MHENKKIKTDKKKKRNREVTLSIHLPNKSAWTTYW